MVLFLFLSFLNVQAGDVGRCNYATNSIQRKCNGVFIAAQVITAFAAFESGKKIQNIKQACEQAQYLSRVVVAGNYAFVTSCQRSITACEKACRYNNTTVCEDYEERVRVATLQSILTVLSQSQSKACTDAVSGKIASEVTHFVGQIENINIPLDVAKTADQNSKEFLDQAIVSHDSYDYEGNNISDKKAKVDTTNNGSADFKAGSGASFAMDKDLLTSEPVRVEKDILQGTRDMQGSSAYTRESLGTIGGALEFDSTYKSKLNLKDFLPNGPKYKRGLASASVNSEVTPANGLNNFQKISRKMNEKRSELLP